MKPLLMTKATQLEDGDLREKLGESLDCILVKKVGTLMLGVERPGVGFTLELRSQTDGFGRLERRKVPDVSEALRRTGSSEDVL